MKDDERKRGWQCGMIEQELEDEPWKKQTRPKKERRSFRRSRLRRRAQRHRPPQSPADDFHPKVPLDLSWETCERAVNFLMEVAGCQYRRAPPISAGSRPMSQASAPSPSPSWDATEGSTGRGDRTAWQAVLEMRR